MLIVVTLSGCAGTGTGVSYDPSLAGEPLDPPETRIGGKALIWTTVEEDEFVLRNFRMGDMAREISLDVFSQFFTGGVEHSNTLPDSVQYAAVITPRVTAFNYEYDSRCGFLCLSTIYQPEVELTLTILVTEQTGEILLERELSRGPVSGRESRSSGYLPELPFDEVIEMVHELIADILNQAATDIYDIFQFRQLDGSVTNER